jgi:hypothetical protein
MTVVAEYVTKDHFDKVMARIDATFVTKDHFDQTLALYVTKDHFDQTLALYVTKDYFDRAMDLIDKRFEVIITMLTELTQIVREDKRKIDTLENDTEEMKENHFALEEAEGKDALASINHEHRIIRLEKRQNIIPNTPYHLLRPE